MTVTHGISARPTTTDDVRAPSHAERCRTLVARARSATLSTIAREPAGYPYGSLVAFTTDLRGAPLLLLSTMAEHRQNLDVRSESSLLVAEAHAPGEDALALGRLTLLGRCTPVDASGAAEARDAFLRVHPRASTYVDFKDFAFYRLTVEAIRYVGGFGRMSWVDVAAYHAAEPDPLVDAAPAIRAHMNADHADALVACARALASIGDATSAEMTSIDRYGFEMRVVTPKGPSAGRVAFDAPLASSEEARGAVIALVKRARSQLA
jgi:putative heme iron utilization protein